MRSASTVLALTAVLAMSALSRSAQAQAPEPSHADETKDDGPAADSEVLRKDPPPPEPPADAEVPEGKELEGEFDPSRDHLEVTMGILGGFTQYSGVNFAYQKGDGPQRLIEPFDAAPFDGGLALGMRIEMRFVASHIRSTLGIDLPFPNFTTEETTASYDVDGQPVEVTVQSLKHQTFRFGVGGEYSFGMFTPYLDVLAGIHFVESRLITDDRFVTYGNTEFGLAARLGARYALKKSFFLHGSVTGGLLGPSRALGELGIGFSLL